MSAFNLAQSIAFALVIAAIVLAASRSTWPLPSRGKDADRKTIVDLATQLLTDPFTSLAGLPNAHPTGPGWRAGPFDIFAVPDGSYPLGPSGDTSTLPAAESNDSPPRRGLDRLNGSLTMKPATPQDLRDIADRSEDSTYFVPLFDRERLRRLADAMEKPYEGAATGDVIARFVSILADNINDCQGRGLTTVVSPLEARKLHAAIIEEGMQTAESLTKAGLAAVRAEDRASEMAGLVDEQARLINSLRASVLRLTDMLKTADDERVEVKFVFVPDPLGDPSAMGVEEAMDLALALEAAR